MPREVLCDGLRNQHAAQKQAIELMERQLDNHISATTLRFVERSAAGAGAKV